MAERGELGYRFTEEDKALAVKLAQEGATMGEIIQRLKTTRSTLAKWLKAAGVEAGRVRAPKQEPEKERAARPKNTHARSLASSPLANRLDRNIQRRLEGEDVG